MSCVSSQDFGSWKPLQNSQEGQEGQIRKAGFQDIPGYPTSLMLRMEGTPIAARPPSHREDEVVRSDIMSPQKVNSFSGHIGLLVKVRLET